MSLKNGAYISHNYNPFINPYMNPKLQPEVHSSLSFGFENMTLNPALAVGHVRFVLLPSDEGKGEGYEQG